MPCPSPRPSSVPPVALHPRVPPPQELAIPVDWGALGDPDGMLVVSDVKVQNLKNKKVSLSRPDPFVRFATTRVADEELPEVNAITQQKTQTAFNKPTFAWKGKYYLPVHSATKHQLTVQVMHDAKVDEELIRQHWRILTDKGEKTEISDSVGMGGKQLEARQKSKKGLDQGKVTFKVEYKPFRQVSEAARVALAKDYLVNPDHQKGNLSVKVDRCTNLCTDFASAKVVLTVTDAADKVLMKAETKVDPETRNPIYGESFDFCNINAACKLRVEIVNLYKPGLLSFHRRVFKKKNLGSVDMPLAKVVAADRITDNFLLREVSTGQIKMTLTWTTIWDESQAAAATAA